MAGPLSITNCEATAGSVNNIVFTFSEPVANAELRPNYEVLMFPSGTVTLASTGTVTLKDTTAIFTATNLTAGAWIQITVNPPSATANLVTTKGGTAIVSPNNIFFTQVHLDDVGVATGDIATNTGRIATSSGRIATSAGSTSQAVEDIAAFSVLTEEIGYSPSPLARPGGWGGAAAPSAGGMLGQIATKAISEVLGWKVAGQGKPDTNTKGFLGALNASFALKEIGGHTEAIWSPRTYAIQTDLSGGITGAQASVYQRAKDALDQSLPLLDGLYPLFKEAKDEDVAALRATIRSQFTDLVGELGLLGGPRISRVTQLFSLLLGQTFPVRDTDVIIFQGGSLGGPLVTDPDKISGSLGNLRAECGFGRADDQVNTVVDEQNVTNFRIVSDYVTSLAQSWLNNLQFFGLDAKTPFFGTQLVLLSRQLSVIAESANEVRFTLDSVFIGPAERQTLQIKFGSPAPADTPSMFLEDLLTWVETFASEEGPRLIEEGGKSGVGQSFKPIGEQLQTLVAGAENPRNVNSLPRGYRTARVQRSLEELADQLQELVNLAAPIQHVITPEPEPGLAVLGINPTAVSANTGVVFITIIGTGFDNQGFLFIDSSPVMPSGALGSVFTGSAGILSDNLAFVTVDTAITGLAYNAPANSPYTLLISMTNRNNPTPVTLVTGFTVQP